MEGSTTPVEGDGMSAHEQLGLASVTYLRTSDDAEMVATAQPNPPELLDLSIPQGATRPNVDNWHVRVTVPLDKAENVGLSGVQRAVRHKLAGRWPNTYWNTGRERFVAAFYTYDASPESIREVGQFAVSLAETLEPMTTGRPSVHIEHRSRSAVEIVKFARNLAKAMQPMTADQPHFFVEDLVGAVSEEVVAD